MDAFEWTVPSLPIATLAQGLFGHSDAEMPQRAPHHKRCRRCGPLGRGSLGKLGFAAERIGKPSFPSSPTPSAVLAPLLHRARRNPCTTLGRAACAAACGACHAVSSSSPAGGGGNRCRQWAIREPAMSANAYYCICAWLSEHCCTWSMLLDDGALIRIWYASRLPSGSDLTTSGANRAKSRTFGPRVHQESGGLFEE